MKHTRATHLLLALAFAIGQWFAIVHTTQHELNSAERLVACEVCAVGHAAAPPPVALTVSVSFLSAVESPIALPATAPRRSLFLRPPSRGPPSLNA